MGESRNQNVVTRRRRWAVGLALAVPLALAVSQSWVAHATAPVQSAFTPITPVRALDSRGVPSMHLSPGHESEVWQVASANSIPSGATAIVLNLTVVNTDATTFLTLWPDLASQPHTSNVNVLAGKTTQATVVVGLSAGGAIDIDPVKVPRDHRSSAVRHNAAIKEVDAVTQHIRGLDCAVINDRRRAAHIG